MRRLIVVTMMLIGCGSGSDSTDSSTPPDIPAPVSFCSSLMESKPLGLACLHCMQPEAEQQVTELARIVAQSCISRVAVNVIVDNSFTFDAARLIALLDKFAPEGQELHAIFYLQNGPGQRQGRDGLVPAFGRSISIADFRRRIKTDKTLRAQYRAIVTRLIPVLQHVEDLNGYNYLVVALEDNLTQREAKEMRSLALAALPPELQQSVTFVRSPCGGCAPGNDSIIPPGFISEQHSLKPGSILTNDGADHNWDLHSLDAMRDAAKIFIIWSHEYQGLGHGSYKPAPELRNYQIPTPAEAAQLTAYLRGEL